ncbi:MAG: nucleotidyltransferase domain-containing protein [Magnetococcales bacterium]|nr:nucleotidyltransferase domain-containing protein [Magnetococcales bacterium]
MANGWSRCCGSDWVVAELDLSQLCLDPRRLAMVQGILRRLLPRSEVWAYGSRITGLSHEASDLDLVARNPDDPNREQPGVAAARTAFMESGLPLRVDLRDWARLPDSFRREIQQGHVVLQIPERRDDSGVFHVP